MHYHSCTQSNLISYIVVCRTSFHPAEFAPYSIFITKVIPACLFPVIAAVFAKTSSLNIKIRGLEAFYTLCGGSDRPSDDDNDVNGIGISDRKSSSTSSSAILDKFTVQEKVVPLMKGIKTKEPGVMMAALRVFRQVGEVADSDYLAMEVIPIFIGFPIALVKRWFNVQIEPLFHSEQVIGALWLWKL